MEFLRYGSRISGSNIGCCGWDIIQDFKQDPDEKAAVQLVSGDGGTAITKYVRKPNGTYEYRNQFFGKTWREVFNMRMRTGTHYNNDMPNHGFLAILTGNQLTTEIGKKWLAILKAHGFQFMGGVQNSVYRGASIGHECYLFALFRNVTATSNPMEPPKAWTDLPEPEGSDLDRWNALPPLVMYEEAELRKEGIPIWMSGTKGAQPYVSDGTEEKKEVPSPFGNPCKVTA